MLWDLRGKSIPVMRTALAEKGHKFPVYSLAVVGTAISHSIVSASNDGLICTWDLKNFNEPVTSEEVQDKTKTNYNVTCLAFPRGDSGELYFGAENGAIYSWELQKDEKESRAYEGHTSHVTGLSINRGESAALLKGMFLSSSLDWSVKLWSRQASRPLWTFEHSDDYIYDVQWNPANGSLFACSNNEGNVHLYNLTEDFDQPQVDLKVERAINKLQWSGDGARLLCGDCDGNLHVLGLDSRLMLYNEEKTPFIEEFVTAGQADDPPAAVL